MDNSQIENTISEIRKRSGAVTAFNTKFHRQTLLTEFGFDVPFCIGENSSPKTRQVKLEEFGIGITPIPISLRNLTPICS